MSGSPRFVADVMLGSLSKWLRILGFDTLYFRDIDDNELIKTAKQQGRVLLTRDGGIAGSRKAGTCVFIHSEDIAGQLKEVLTAFPFTLSGSRCAGCNGELSPAGRGDVAGDVPDHVFLNFNSFFRCNNCGKVYWEGSHRKTIDERIRGVLEEIGVHWEHSGEN